MFSYIYHLGEMITRVKRATVTSGVCQWACMHPMLAKQSSLLLKDPGKPPSQKLYFLLKTAVRAGQTGSGKSHTLIGGERGLAEQRGVMPRAVEALWQGIAASQQVRAEPRHSSFLVDFSM